MHRCRCRCRYPDDPERARSRAPKCTLNYQACISSPLSDRTEPHVDVPDVSPEDLTLPPPAEGSAEGRARVEPARMVLVEPTAVGVR